MYKTKTNVEIGKYLSELIREQFITQRQFCKAYLKARDNTVPDDVQIQRMTNRGIRSSNRICDSADGIFHWDTLVSGEKSDSRGHAA